jgi:Autographiviridae endonuclease
MPSEKRICSVNGCGGRHFGNGFCAKHNYRWNKHGDPLVTAEARRPKVINVAPCPVAGCGREPYSKGLCNPHYERLRRTGELSPEVPIGGPDKTLWTDEQWAAEIMPRFVRQPNGCLEWTGNIRNGAYGRVWFRGKMQPAHRVSYMLNVGPIPEGMVICHHCDNPPCGDPEHLFLGEIADNHADMTMKGRGFVPVPRRGEKHERATVTEAEVLHIRASHHAGESQSAIARRMGVDRQTVTNICLGKTWKHVGGPIRAPRAKRSRLPDAMVLEIRSSNERNVDIAARLGIDKQTVSDIRCGRIYVGVRDQRITRTT